MCRTLVLFLFLFSAIGQVWGWSPSIETRDIPQAAQQQLMIITLQMANLEAIKREYVAKLCYGAGLEPWKCKLNPQTNKLEGPILPSVPADATTPSPQMPTSDKKKEIRK